MSKLRANPFRRQQRSLRHSMTSMDGPVGQMDVTHVPRQLRAYRYAAQAVIGVELGGPIANIALGTLEQNDGVFWELTPEQCRPDNPFALRVLIARTCVDGIVSADHATGGDCFAAILFDPEIRSCANAMMHATKSKQPLVDIIRCHYEYVDAVMDENYILIASLAKTLLQRNKMGRDEILDFINNSHGAGATAPN